MRKTLVLFYCAIICTLCLHAQSDSVQKQYILQTSSTTFGLSTVSLLDNYLSPLPYKGIGLRITHEDRQFMSPNNDRLSSLSRIRLETGTTHNPAQTASLLFAGLDYTWGIYYHFRPIKHMQILTGGLADVDFGAKTITRNVNNPGSFDMALNLNLSAVVIYDIPLKKRTLRLQGTLESPWIGCMFVPAQGSSYYEIFSLGASGNFVHFSSFHNKLSLRQNYFVEIPFANSCWRFGISCDLTKWSANQLVFKQNDATVYFGYTRTLTSFNKKHPAPDNFIGI